MWWITLPESLGPCDLSVVLLRWIDEGGLAELAGRRVGDVLLEFNGQAIRDSGLLRQMLARHNRLQVFRVRYFRSGLFGDAIFTATRDAL
ncbi:MAG: hypothetical protein JNL99_11365 [Zoogloea sp.]|nr:hypothetical protein [Zoogloea sp.]